MTQNDVAAALEEIGTLLALSGENDFRTRAYTNAARTISQFTGDLNAVVRGGKLGEIRGIGVALRDKITILVTTGRLPYLEQLRASVPPGLIAMLRVPGLGPKKIIQLQKDLQIDSLEKLEAACLAGQVAELKGFGAKSQERILEGIRFLGTVGNRVRIDEALPLGEALLARVRAFPGVIRAELCGSLRRRRETVKDIDIVASSADPGPVMDAFVKLPQVIQVTGHGTTKSSIVAALMVGLERVVMSADLRVVTEEQFPVAMLHFTGSKEHNVRLRQRANERGWSLNEYALSGDNAPGNLRTEADIYGALDLEWVPPEMREDTGEIDVMAARAVPKLLEPGDIRGVFHNHTTASDGTATLKEMARAAQALGYEYFGVGDHSQSLTVANGLNAKRVRQQWAEIDEWNSRLTGIRILKGTECDILQDGSLDYPDQLLAGFDYVVASVHSHFTLSEEEQTTRICKALAHPAVTMLGHATGRLLLRREGYKLNLERVLQTAAEHGKMIEINAQPSRLDLDWLHVKRAKELGIPLVINPDAHSPEDLALVPFGVMVARRGWLTQADLFNTRSLTEVLAELEKRKAAWMAQSGIETEAQTPPVS
ncbi:MAG: DNA polymerase/3'-5' exonuclease PolX [Bacteroidales bacterium]|nr:DNA polymerase/3'-5' exonuclease PolX [Bacteroidales bacterium]